MNQSIRRLIATFLTTLAGLTAASAATLASADSGALQAAGAIAATGDRCPEVPGLIPTF